MNHKGHEGSPRDTKGESAFEFGVRRTAELMQELQEVGSRERAEANRTSRLILDAAFTVHSKLGPGLLESAYRACLQHELRKHGCKVEAEISLPMIYDGVRLDVGYRIDLLIDDAVIVELKTVDSIAPIHKAQLLSYLKLSDKYLGLLINFNVVHLREGFTQMVRGSGWKKLPSANLCDPLCPSWFKVFVLGLDFRFRGLRITHGQ